MTIIQRLPEIVYPLTQINKVNEIVDIINITKNSSYAEENPALTPVEGVATWTVTHNLGTENVNCSVFYNNSVIIVPTNVISENAITVTFNSTSNIPAETYKVIVMAEGSLAGSSGGSSVTIDSALSTTSINPVQNRVITEALNKLNGRKYDISTGNIASSSIDSTFKCIGGATITIYNSANLVRIDYEYVVTVSGSLLNDWQYGLSAEYLKNNNEYGVVPDITPITGGHITIYNSGGYINSNLQGYGGGHTANGKYWAPSRVFNKGSAANPHYVYGQWPRNEINKDTRIIGVAYGTYTRQ